MRAAFQKDEDFLADVEKAGADPASLHLWWLGQSGFLLRWKGASLLFDPYLSDSLTEKYRATDKPHVRMTERVVSPSRLNFVSVVTSSHRHTDHLDAATLRPLMAVNRDLKLIIPEANREFVTERLRCRKDFPIGLDAGESCREGVFQISAVPAAHEKLERDEQGRYTHLGFVVRCGDWSVYHSGDTVLFDGIEECLEPFDLDVVLLPINGRRPERRVAGNLSGAEAAWLAKRRKARLAIPCHFDMFEFNTASPAEFVAECESLGQKFMVLGQGQGWTLSRGEELKAPSRGLVVDES